MAVGNKSLLLLLGTDMHRLQCAVQKYAWGKVGTSSTVMQLQVGVCAAAAAAVTVCFTDVCAAAAAVAVAVVFVCRSGCGWR